MTARGFELDNDWETFKLRTDMGNDYDLDTNTESTERSSVFSSNRVGGISNLAANAAVLPHSSKMKPRPTCTPIYISTTTKIAYLNEHIDIRRVFWEIPIVRYIDPREGVIKKQIKFSTTDPAELAAVLERIGKERYVDNQEMEHIDNPEGRIKFKDQRKISIGLSKKDILCYRSKKKRAFFNCFVLILRIRDVVPGSDTDADTPFKEMHVKVFNTGKLEIPGIQTDNMLELVLKMVVGILRPFVCVGEQLDYIPGRCDTVLINSNFNCGFYINRDKLHELLKYKYRINSNYDSCSYPGIQSKFYYVNGCEKNGQPHQQTGQQPADTVDCCEISFMIFRTGSVLIVGKCTDSVLFVIYDFLKTVLEREYELIVNDVVCQPIIGAVSGAGTGSTSGDFEVVPSLIRKKPALKVQRRTIIVTS